MATHGVLSIFINASHVTSRRVRTPLQHDIQTLKVKLHWHFTVIDKSPDLQGRGGVLRWAHVSSWLRGRHDLGHVLDASLCLVSLCHSGCCPCSCWAVCGTSPSAAHWVTTLISGLLPLVSSLQGGRRHPGYPWSWDQDVNRMLSYSSSEHPDAYVSWEHQLPMKIPLPPRASSGWALMSHWCHCSGARGDALLGWRKEASWLPADLQAALAYKAPNKPSPCSRPFLSLYESRAMKWFRHTVKESFWSWAGFYSFTQRYFNHLSKTREGTDISQTEIEASLRVRCTQILALNRWSRMQAHSKKHRFWGAVEQLGSWSLSDTKWELHRGDWGRNMCLCTSRVTLVWNLSFFLCPAEGSPINNLILN